MRGLAKTELRRLFCYNPLSGTLMWRVSPSNNIKIGRVAGRIIRRDKRRYRKIEVHRRQYRAHRLAFLYMRGFWPQEVDHKDGDGLNNSWRNLRECTRSQNLANRGPTKNNKLGIKGVTLRESGRYQAQIRVRGTKIYLGHHDTSKAAVRAYRKAARKHFGQFAS